MRYADTLALVSRLPELRPAAMLPRRLCELFDVLRCCTDGTRATQVEDAIWNVWMHDGHDGAVRALERTCTDIAARCYDMAETRLMLLLRWRSDWAEAWNKVATLYYLQNRDDESVAAIHRTLQIEPRHFGALCGLGEILRAQGETEAACLAFERALRVHPQMESIRETLESLRPE